jgi:hypothetical protein
MTAVNCVLQGKRAYLYADTAHTSLKTGLVVGLRSKLLIGTNFPWALASSGQSLSPTALAAAVDRAMPRNVATFVKALPSILEEGIAVLETEGVTNPPLALTLAVWDARLRCTRCFMVESDGTALTSLGVAPFTATELDYTATGRGIGELLGRDVDPMKPGSFDPDADGQALMEAQRRELRWAGAAGQQIACIGGELEQAVVGKAGVEVYSLFAWPDRVGFTIRT